MIQKNPDSPIWDVTGNTGFYRKTFLFFIIFFLWFLFLINSARADTKPTAIPTNTPTLTPTNTVTPTPTCTSLLTSTPWLCENRTYIDTFSDCTAWTNTCEEDQNYAEVECAGGELSMHGFDGNWTGASREFYVVPGHQYEVSLDMKVDDDKDSSMPQLVAVGFGDSNCNSCVCPSDIDYPTQTLDPSYAQGYYYTYQLDGLITANTGIACIRIFMVPAGGGGQDGFSNIFIDNITITDVNVPTCTPTPTPTCTFIPTSTPWSCEPVADGFEDACAEWSADGSTGWTAGCSSAEAHSGNSSFEMSPGFDEGWVGAVRSFNVRPGNSYEVSAWFRGGISVYVKADLVDAECNSCSPPTFEEPPANFIYLSSANWEKHTIEYTAQIDTSMACLRIFVLDDGGKNPTIYIDDIEIRDNGEPTCTPTDTPTPTNTPWKISEPTPLLKGFYFYGDEDSDGGRDIQPR